MIFGGLVRVLDWGCGYVGVHISLIRHGSDQISGRNIGRIAQSVEYRNGNLRARVQSPVQLLLRSIQAVWSESVVDLLNLRIPDSSPSTAHPVVYPCSLIRVCTTGLTYCLNFYRLYEPVIWTLISMSVFIDPAFASLVDCAIRSGFFLFFVFLLFFFFFFVCLFFWGFLSEPTLQQQHLLKNIQLN